MKLRIALVCACPYPVPQGSQVFLRENALALRERGHEVHLVVYGSGLGADLSGLTVHRCPRIPGDTRTAAGPSLVKPFVDLALLVTLRHIIRQEHIDVVFAHNYEGLLVALAAGKRPIIYHAHNAMADELPYYFSSLGNSPEKIGRWLDRTFPRRADRIVVPHRRLAGHLIVRGCDHTKITVVAPPIDGEKFQVSQIEQGIPPVLYTGNLDAYQNLGLLFDSMERVRKRLKNARLLVATAEDARIPGAETVPTHGFDALQRVLAQDSVFAVPRVSWSGYPIKLLNAMAAGKPIVACQSAAYPITHEHNGIIVPDNDAPAFAAALLRLMLDAKKRRELGNNARQTILAQHKPGDIAQQLETLALDLIKARTPPEQLAAREHLPTTTPQR